MSKEHHKLFTFEEWIPPISWNRLGVEDRDSTVSYFAGGYEKPGTEILVWFQPLGEDGLRHWESHDHENAPYCLEHFEDGELEAEEYIHEPEQVNERVKEIIQSKE